MLKLTFPADAVRRIVEQAEAHPDYRPTYATLYEELGLEKLEDYTEPQLRLVRDTACGNEKCAC